MSYQCGIGPNMAQLGFTPCDPHIVCDDCGATYYPPAKRVPPLWFLNGKAPRGWLQVRTSTADIVSRRDYCPRCKGKEQP